MGKRQTERSKEREREGVGEMLAKGQRIESREMISFLLLSDCALHTGTHTYKCTLAHTRKLAHTHTHTCTHSVCWLRRGCPMWSGCDTCSWSCLIGIISEFLCVDVLVYMCV